MRAVEKRIQIVIKSLESFAIASGNCFKIGKNIATKEDTDAFNAPYIFRGIIGIEENPAKAPPTFTSRTVFVLEESAT